MTRTLHELQLTTSRADPPPPLPTIFGSLVFLTDDEIQDAHHHDKHELIWHVSGNLRVESGDQVWLVLPGAGLWLPAGTPHAIEGSAGSRYGWACSNRTRAR